MTTGDLETLKDHLIERDYQLLHDVDVYRLLTSRQIQRLSFDPHHPTPLASARACNRALARLRHLGVINALQRRIGGARAGSAGYVWHIAAAGERVLRSLDPNPTKGRRNYREPSRHFVDHTLAVAQLALQVIEADRAGQLKITDLQTEPASWQTSLSPHGTTLTLKPDLRLVTTNGDYEDHWFLEADLATEHLPVIVRQCTAYQTYRETGRYQTSHGLFPAVVWIVPTEHRRVSVSARILAEAQLDVELFTVITADQLPSLLLAGAKDFNTSPQASDRPEGEAPS